MKKHLPSILASLLVAFGVGVFVAHAQGYTPLAPLPGTYTGAVGAETTDLTTYLSGAIKLIIGVGAATAILMTIIGGTQYVAAGISPDAKSTAKTRITNSFIGLALILTSYLILNSINPKLVQFDLSLKSVGVVVTPVEPSTSAWPDDSAVRSVLANDSHITFNRPTSCTTIGEQGCTSVYNLNGNAIIELRALDANTCSRRNAIGILANNCNVVVTGGTEYWLHQTHGDGTRETSTKVDLHKGSSDGVLDNYIKKNGTIPETPCGIRNAPKYQPNGATGGTYVDEGDHWHVCY